MKKQPRGRGTSQRYVTLLTCSSNQAIPATFMRGGTSKGVFLRVQDLPQQAQKPGPYRDQLLQRVIGSPDPYQKQIDGMGGATSSTSKVVLVSPSCQTDHDVDYCFGQVSIESGALDWSGNCGNLTAAVGAFALYSGFIPAHKVPDKGTVSVRIWQSNIQKTLIAHVPVEDGRVVEQGNFRLNGVTFPSAPIKVDFVDPAGRDTRLFPTGKTMEVLNVANVGDVNVTMMNAGIPIVFLEAKTLGLTGVESQDTINSQPELLDTLENIRQHASVAMGLTPDLAHASQREHTPKVAFVAQPQSYIASGGSAINANDIDCVVRALSMGKLHHAMMGTAAVAIASAANIPETVVANVCGKLTGGVVTFGHPSGTLSVSAEVICHRINGQRASWEVKNVSMQRSARVLMRGDVFVPQMLGKT